MLKRICVVGGGYWGKNHIRTLAELGYLGGIVETNKELLLKNQKNYPNVKCFSTLEESLF